MREVHCKRPFLGNLVDVRDYIIKKVKRDKDSLRITCDGLNGSMTMNYDKIDKNIQAISREIQSRRYRKNTYRLITFVYENNEQYNPG